MASPLSGPNPLRPYYIPAAAGLPSDATSNITASNTLLKNGSSAATYASTARDIFSDIDYADYVSEGSQSTLGTMREVLDQAMYKYMSVLLAQPFEVAKTLLQVRCQAEGNGIITIVGNDARGGEGMGYSDEDEEEDSDPDEPAYFTSNAPSSTSYSPSRTRSKNITDRAGYVLPLPGSTQPHQLSLKRTDSIMEVIGQVWNKEGAVGVWKGSNATFLYGMLSKAVESWSRSFLAAIANVPDPGNITGLGPAAEVVDLMFPWSSLGVAVGAAAIAAVVLAPLDIVRTKQILTSTTRPTKKRGILPSLRNLPSYLCPTTLFLPTILHAMIPPLFVHGTPLLLRSHLGIDQVLTPSTFSLATFMSSAIELFVKLPLETVLRRGQMASLMTGDSRMGKGGLTDAIVDVGAYRGVLGTMWLIVREEGESGKVSTSRIGGSGRMSGTAARGQGVAGLWRGWRVGMWGLAGMWGAAVMGSVGGNGGEF